MVVVTRSRHRAPSRLPRLSALVEVERLNKSFGRVRALSEVSFSVAEGEVLGFLGPNGAGKPTTIRILLGLLHGHGGTAKRGGHDCWTDHAPASRFFGATLEQPGFYGFLSGTDTLHQPAPLP